MLSLNSNTSLNYLINQRRNKTNILIHNRLIQDYQTNTLDYGSSLIKTLIHNESNHFVVLYKELCLIENNSEFLTRFYNHTEANVRLNKLINYYEKYSKIFPNYNVITEGKYFFRNIQRKQIMIDLQEEMENKEKDKKQKLDEGINRELNEDLFNTDIYESIVNDNNKEEIEMLFNINYGDKDKENGLDEKREDSDSEIVRLFEEIINQIDNCETKSIKNQNQMTNTSLSFIMSNSNSNNINTNNNHITKSHSTSGMTPNIKEIKPKLTNKHIDSLIKKQTSYSLIEQYLKDKLSNTIRSKKDFVNISASQISHRSSSNINNNSSSSTKMTNKKDSIPNSNNNTNLHLTSKVPFSSSCLAQFNLYSTINFKTHISSAKSHKENVINHQPHQSSHHYTPDDYMAKKARIICSRNFNFNPQLNPKTNKSVIQKTNHLSSKIKHDKIQRQLKLSHDFGSVNSLKESKTNNNNNYYPQNNNNNRAKSTKDFLLVNSIVSKLQNIKMNKKSRNSESFNLFFKETLKMIHETSKKSKGLEKTKSSENVKNKISDKDVQFNSKESKTPYKVIFTKDRKIVTHYKRESSLKNCIINNSNNTNTTRVYEYQYSVLSNKHFR